jgi:hypothetical protein
VSKLVKILFKLWQHIFHQITQDLS